MNITYYANNDITGINTESIASLVKQFLASSSFHKQGRTDRQFLNWASAKGTFDLSDAQWDEIHKQVTSQLKAMKTESPLMNIDSNRLVNIEIDQHVKVGDTIHTKGNTITNWCHTWEVTKVTPKQVHCVLKNLWFPVFEHTGLGRIAKGEDADNLAHLNEHKEAQVNNLKRKFWKDGRAIGHTIWGCVHVVVV